MKILIITEDHADSRSSKALLDIITHLNSNRGFNALCLDYSQDNSSVEMLNALLTNTLQCIDTMFITPFLRHLPINGQKLSKQQLTEMDVKSLCDLIEDSHLFSDNFTAARAINSYITTSAKLSILRMLNKRMAIRCIDTNTNNIGARDMQQRAETMCAHLQSLVSEDKKIVVLVGRMHTAGLIEHLTANGLINDTLFIHLKSAMTAKHEMHLSATNKDCIYMDRPGVTMRSVMLQGIDYPNVIAQIDREINSFDRPLIGNFNPDLKIDLPLSVKRPTLLKFNAQQISAQVDEIKALRASIEKEPANTETLAPVFKATRPGV